jgi:hypothetical protein
LEVPEHPYITACEEAMVDVEFMHVHIFLVILYEHPPRHLCSHNDLVSQEEDLVHPWFDFLFFHPCWLTSPWKYDVEHEIVIKFSGLEQR